MNTAKLLVLTLALALIVPTAAAAPLAGPCVAGGVYDPACDADRDGDVDIFDIQLTAGHWNQTGAYVSDNNHNHLGQTWTGSSNPLKLTGSYNAPDYAALVLSNSAGYGLSIASAAYSGVAVDSAGGAGVDVFSAGNDGVYVGSAGGDGMIVGSADDDGVYVSSAGGAGVAVWSAGSDGVVVRTAGNPSTYAASPRVNGFEIAGAEGDGIFVGRADVLGIEINSAGLDAFYAANVGRHGLHVTQAAQHGVRVAAAGIDGVNATGSQYAGNFAGNINVTGNCIGCRQANFAVNAGDRPLQPGDVVTILGTTSANFDTGSTLWQVARAQPGQTVVGVVTGWAEPVTLDERRSTESGKRLVLREGAAQPGEYVTVVYSGPMQVRVAPGESAIAAGTRLAAAADGTVRPLQTRTVEGIVVAEGAPVMGVALEAAKDGLVWVLVNPQ